MSNNPIPPRYSRSGFMKEEKLNVPFIYVIPSSLPGNSWALRLVHRSKEGTTFRYYR